MYFVSKYIKIHAENVFKIIFLVLSYFGLELGEIQGWDHMPQSVLWLFKKRLQMNSSHLFFCLLTKKEDFCNVVSDSSKFKIKMSWVVSQI